MSIYKNGKIEKSINQMESFHIRGGSMLGNNQLHFNDIVNLPD